MIVLSALVGSNAYQKQQRLNLLVICNLKMKISRSLKIIEQSEWPQ